MLLKVGVDRRRTLTIFLENLEGTENCTAKWIIILSCRRTPRLVNDSLNLSRPFEHSLLTLFKVHCRSHSRC